MKCVYNEVGNYANAKEEMSRCRRHSWVTTRGVLMVVVHKFVPLLSLAGGGWRTAGGRRGVAGGRVIDSSIWREEIVYRNRLMSYVTLNGE